MFPTFFKWELKTVSKNLGLLSSQGLQTKKSVIKMEFYYFLQFLLIYLFWEGDLFILREIKIVFYLFICLFVYLFIYLFFTVFIILKKRERTWHRAQSHELWDHDLNWNQESDT